MNTLIHTCPLRVRSPGERSVTGFTLVELLVVIAIIGLLAALVLPALSAARNRGHLAVCSSNMKQVATACILYAGANDGELPVSYRDGQKVVGLTLWEKLVPYLSERKGDHPSVVFRCPSAIARGWNHLALKRPATMAANHVVMNQDYEKKFRMGEIQQPMKAMLYACSSSWSTAWGGTLSETVSASVPPGFPHSGKTMANGGNGNGQWHYLADGDEVFVFADGHVESLGVTPITLGNTSTPEGRLFWIGRPNW